jgi:hypothetical protein
VGRDAQPGPGLKATRGPIAAPTPHARRVDYASERAGTASVCMVAEPLQGWRDGRVRPPRPTVAGALEMAALRRTRYAEAHQVIGGGDHFNTHTLGALYEACAAERARQRVRRRACRSTPKHGSWRNMAENALRALTRQCVHDRRFGDTEPLAAETAAWSTSSHEKQRGVDWQCKINDARTKLKSLYPKIQD